MPVCLVEIQSVAVFQLWLLHRSRNYPDIFLSGHWQLQVFCWSASSADIYHVRLIVMFPENYLKISKGELGVKSDNKGNQGLPDGDTDDSFENISFRAYNKELKIKCLNGGYQPFLKGITGLEAALEERSLVTLNLFRQYDFLDSGLPGSMETKLQLWNLKPNLFPEIKP